MKQDHPPFTRRQTRLVWSAIALAVLLHWVPGDLDLATLGFAITFAWLLGIAQPTNSQFGAAFVLMLLAMFTFALFLFFDARGASNEEIVKMLQLSRSAPDDGNSLVLTYGASGGALLRICRGLLGPGR